MTATRKASATRVMRLGVSLAVLVTLGSVIVVTGHAAKQTHKAQHLVTDWSHRHLIFSQPRSAEEARRLAEDPRYDQQFRRLAARHLMQVEMPEFETPADSRISRTIYPHGRNIRRDWSELLGSGGALPANFFPAKYNFDVNTASCASATNPDFAVFSTGQLSSGTQASIVAYDNLYIGCSGSAPSVYWAYDTGGQILTSPVFSEDGTQLAFVQTNPGLQGTVVLLKWAPSATDTVTSPTTLTAVANTAYPTCTAPCMTTFLLKDRSSVVLDDRTSSIFYDYKDDIAFVGGERGVVNKFIDVFVGGSAKPPHRAQGNFPVELSGGSALSNTVFDHRTVNVFVGDASGFLYSIDATSAVAQKSPQLDFGAGIVDTPIVDSNGQFVYTFVSSDGSALCSGGPCAALYSLSTHFVSGDIPTKATVGASSPAPPNPNPLYAGTFDSTYYTSQIGTGNLYVCGNTGGAPTLYQVPLVLGVPGTALPVGGGALSGVTTGCSPVTDIQHPNPPGTLGQITGPSEWIFTSAQDGGVASACSSGGCLFRLTVTPWLPDTFYALNQEVLDSNLNIQVVTSITGGRTGNTPPVWNVAVKGDTTDGNGIAVPVVWQNQGALSVISPPLWQSGHPYTTNVSIVLDSNNNLEICNHTGTSGATAPAWVTNAGGSTSPDGTVRWINLGPNPTSALAAAGGTTGLIMDNVVNAATLNGASQVYFSTLGSQTCATSGGTGNCAVQASQPGLN